MGAMSANAKTARNGPTNPHPVQRGEPRRRRRGTARAADAAIGLADICVLFGRVFTQTSGCLREHNARLTWRASIKLDTRDHDSNRGSRAGTPRASMADVARLAGV